MEDEKVPISNESLRQLTVAAALPHSCSEQDLRRLFREGRDNMLSILLYNAISHPPPSHGTESSFHSFWDRNTRDILELIFPDGESIRDSNRNTSTYRFHPDYGFLLKGLCTFRGEEKGPENLGDPRVELRDKLIWAYHPAPYVFGYYVTGTRLTLAAIGPPPSLGGKPVVVDIASSNLQRRSSRVEHICHLINLATLFTPVTDMVDIRDAEFQQIHRSYCSIELSGPRVIKTYTCLDSEERIDRLKCVYNQLVQKKVPCVDELTHVSG